MYADDVVLLSESHVGLQNCLNKLSKFTDDWHMNINMNKTKVLVFNKAGRLKNIPILFDGKPLDCVQRYTYLGVVFSASGSFASAKQEIYNKSIKALFKLRKSFTTVAPRAHVLYTFLIIPLSQCFCMDQRSGVALPLLNSGKMKQSLC